MDRLVKILFILFALLNVNNVIAEAQLTGYLSTNFGMSSEEVRAVFEKDGVVFSNRETNDGYHMIFFQ